MNAIENYYAGREHLDNVFYAEAIEYFKASVELERNFKPYECLPRCYAALNKPEKAFECISQAYTEKTIKLRRDTPKLLPIIAPPTKYFRQYSP